MGDRGSYPMAITAAELSTIKNSEIIAVVVKPNSRNNELLGYNSEKKVWIIAVKAAAEKDAANKELLRFLKKETGRMWAIKSGSHSREKILSATSS